MLHIRIYSSTKYIYYLYINLNENKAPEMIYNKGYEAYYKDKSQDAPTCIETELNNLEP
jgi:hypothetical protein